MITVGDACRTRWGGLAGREHGDPGGAAPGFVLLHGLTFDRRMWDPVLDALPVTRQALAFDLPGHGGSPGLDEPGLAVVVDALHEAVLEAELDAPIMVGHSIGGPLAAIYAATYPASGVVSIDAPIRFEQFAGLLRSLAPQLAGDGFDDVWAQLRAGLRIERVPARYRSLLDAREEPLQQVFLDYQWDLLERPLENVVRWRENGLSELGRSGVPYIALQTDEVDHATRAWLVQRVPQAEIHVWPVGHHFPHLEDPDRFAALLLRLR
jgi:pimeloyl-ACP methyl ester carboxylesterase